MIRGIKDKNIYIYSKQNWSQSAKGDGLCLINDIAELSVHKAVKNYSFDMCLHYITV